LLANREAQGMTLKTAQEIVKELQLLPHPEGGYYKEVYRSDMAFQSPATHAERNALTCIYFLLEKGQISRFHRVKHDEVWNFYLGDPLRLIDLSNNHKDTMLLGDYQNSLQAQHTIKANHWQAAETTGEYSLVGCTVAPGFDFADFTFLADHGDCQKISNQYPELAIFI